MTETKKTPGGRFYELKKEVDVPEPYVLTEDIVIPPMTKSQFLAVGTAETEEERAKALFGDKAEAVLALFADEPGHLWLAFQEEYQEHALGKGVGEVPGKSAQS